MEFESKASDWGAGQCPVSSKRAEFGWPGVNRPAEPHRYNYLLGVM